MNTMNDIAPVKEHLTYCKSYRNTKEKLQIKFQVITERKVTIYFVLARLVKSHFLEDPGLEISLR